MPYTIEDTKEVKALIRKSLADSRRLRETFRPRKGERPRPPNPNLTFYNGEINAYEHTLEMLEGLEKGQSLSHEGR